MTCLEGGIFLSADSASATRWKFVSKRQDEKWQNYFKNGVKIYNLTFFTLCLRGSCWRQEGATCCGGRGGGAQKALFLQSQAVGRVGDLTVIEQGFRGIELGKGLHEFISDSHRLQRLALAVSILLFLAAAWSHD